MRRFPKRRSASSGCEAAVMLSVERRGAVLRVRLSRPEVRNAFNGELIDALKDALTSVEEGVRVLVLSGDGPVFCAGADLHWMRGVAGWTREQHRHDAERLFDL